MKLTSVRARLTLGNIAILALVLFGFLLAVRLSVRGFLFGMMDRGLQEAANRGASMMVSGPPPGPIPPPPPKRRNDRGFEPVRLYDMDGKRVTPFGTPETKEDAPWDKAALKQAQAGIAIFSHAKADGTSYRIYTRSVRRSGKQIGVIQAAFPLAETEVVLEHLAVSLIALVPVALVIAGFGGLFLTNLVLRPVRQIAAAAGGFSADDLAHRLPVVGGDEFAKLATAINVVLAGQEEAFTQLRNAIERERRFTADASHELRTPLTAIKANTTLMLRGEKTPTQYHEALKAIDQSTDTMTGLVQDLLLLAQSDSGQMAVDFQAIDPHALLEEAASIRREGQADVQIRVADSLKTIHGDRAHLLRLLANLLQNALRHTPADGHVTLEAAEEAGRVVLSVTDTGEGIAPEHLPHLGERFYRIDDSRTRGSGGTGLGLAICKSIVEAHSGSIKMESAPGKGTMVSVSLPAST